MNKKIGIILLSAVFSCVFTGCTQNVENHTVTISLAEEQISGRRSNMWIGYIVRMHSRDCVG